MKNALLALLLLAGSAAAADAPAKRRWKHLARMPVPLSNPIVLGHKGVVYVIGGNPKSGVPTPEVRAYFPAQDRWVDRTPAPQNVAYPAAAVLDGAAVIAGGCVRADCSYPTDAVRRYDLTTDAWSDLTPLPEPLWGSQGAAIGGKFFVFGGIRGPIHSSWASDRVYMYDPKTREWTRKKDMARPRQHAAGAEFNGRFLMAGGCTGAKPGNPCLEVTAAVDAYDAATDSWSPAPALPEPVYAIGATAAAGRVFVGGGTSSVEESARGRVLMLAPGASRWSDVAPLIKPRYIAYLFTLDSDLGAAGSDPTNNPEDLIETLPDAGTLTGTAPAVAAAPAAGEPDEDALPEQRPLRPRAHAVIIGVEKYREKLPAAEFAASDAKLAVEYYRRVLGVPEENIALLLDDRAAKSDFEKYLERWLPNRVEPGDEVYVFFSGHGSPSPAKGEAYLVPFDGDPSYIENTGYPLARLYEQLSKLPAKRVVVAMDSCFSGAGGRSVVAKGARPLMNVVATDVPGSLTVLSASASDQISNSHQEKGHGLFTYYLLRGLKQKGPDFKLAFDYLKPEVTRVARRQYNTDQVPQFRGGK